MSKRKGTSRGRNQRPAQALPTRATPPQPHRPQTPYERELTTKRRGEISELAFALAAARHGFGISKPFGDSERYDIILDPSHLDPRNPQARPSLVRVQVKSSTQMMQGFYRVNAHRRINGRAVPYTLAEIDFFAAYVIPEDSWFIFPLPHILGQTGLLLNPKRRRKRHCNDPYREAWHLLYQPDSLEFA